MARVATSRNLYSRNLLAEFTRQYLSVETPRWKRWPFYLGALTLALRMPTNM